MTGSELAYAVITPARNEAQNLERLGEALLAQTSRPAAWVIVDDGSTDGTRDVAVALAAAHDWIHACSGRGEVSPTRGGPIVRAFKTGLSLLTPVPDVVVKLDADVSIEPDHFERLLCEFRADPRLGIASSTCMELDDGVWREQPVARSHVRGAVRAYRRDCLLEVSPLEERFGWDGIDELKAQVKGWTTRSIGGIFFFHHRATGARDGSRQSWTAQGQLAWFLHYRLSYLVLRTLFRSVRDPWAVAIVYGWTRAALAREPRYRDRQILEHLRDQQRLGGLPARAREVLGNQLGRGTSSPRLQ